jgi:hypothetical protein
METDIIEEVHLDCLIKTLELDLEWLRGWKEAREKVNTRKYTASEERQTSLSVFELRNCLHQQNCPVHGVSENLELEFGTTYGTTKELHPFRKLDDGRAREEVSIDTRLIGLC